MTRIARGPGGSVLPVCDQPWFGGSRTPRELIEAWERADREDRMRFDAWRRQEREALAKNAAKWRTAFIVGWFVLVILLVSR